MHELFPWTRTFFVSPKIQIKYNRFAATMNVFPHVNQLQQHEAEPSNFDFIVFVCFRFHFNIHRNIFA